MTEYSKLFRLSVLNLPLAVPSNLKLKIQNQINRLPNSLNDTKHEHQQNEKYQKQRQTYRCLLGMSFECKSIK